ncbi:MAG: VWA domain-containing protein [Lachnospiraceae bacterium]|nr:VWA domain-containing protein [Lachnospiraceae bacterium]
MAVSYLHSWIIAVVLLLILAAAIWYIFRPDHDHGYHGGVRAANTQAVKRLPYYRRLFLRMWICRGLLIFGLVLSLIGSAVLMARPYQVRKVTNGVQKRDIFLCMDVSYSLYALNYDLTEYLETIVRQLEGDRFGITIFNTSSVVYVPMTDDYDYVIQRLEELKEYFVLQKEYEELAAELDYNLYNATDEQYERYLELIYQTDYFEAGTLVNNEVRGSSLIGEGLASCLYSFPSIGDSTRTRAIIFATDNANAALEKELVELPEAAQLCAKNKVTVFGIFPEEEHYYADYTKDDYAGFAKELKQCVERTGGEFYVQSQDGTVAEIVDQVRRHEAMTVDTIVTEQTTDLPEAPFWVMFAGFAIAVMAGVELRR